MSLFLIPAESEISVGGVAYKADARGVVEVPFEHDDTLVNLHGLTRYVEAPAAATVESPAAEVPAARGPGRPRKADAVLVAEEAPAAEVPAE